MQRLLGGLPNVHLLEPLEYVPFVYLMMPQSYHPRGFGGIQEEAPSLSDPSS